MARKYFTTKQIAERYELAEDRGVETVRLWIRTGRLVPENIGTKRKPIYRVSEEELDRFAEENKKRAVA